MKRILLILSFCLISGPALAIAVDKDRLQDPAQEARAQHIMRQLRCLVCQNESITDSDADLAADLRAIVREQIKAGKSEQDILAFMTGRYGDWVLLKPPFKATTALLWLGPLFLLIGGGIMVVRFIKKRPESDQAAPLSAEEKQRLDQILGED